MSYPYQFQILITDMDFNIEYFTERVQIGRTLELEAKDLELFLIILSLFLLVVLRITEL